jgi:hypothetical protein
MDRKLFSHSSPFFGLPDRSMFELIVDIQQIFFGNDPPWTNSTPPTTVILVKPCSVWHSFQKGPQASERDQYPRPVPDFVSAVLGSAPLIAGIDWL